MPLALLFALSRSFVPTPSSDPSTGPPDAPRTRAEFETMLSDVLRGAYLNDVDIGFGVDLRHTDEVPDYEVQITPIRKPQFRD